ncbi:PorT family protein [Spirosoma taeanense]|uniref:PorT family protein n=1 Tax=Spirosoma taeanense TaxID=2735870 RepID=A0A6M5YBR8_9BACT|nr:outer membrane beta-barrel protein [Spirosoma taeanense]QJW90701.1 PorT family protein [Spirosoma taeanense]
MKTHVTLLATCLLGAGIVNGQNTMNNSSTTTTTTNSTYSATPTTTTIDSTNAASQSNMNNGATMSNGTMSNGSTMTNGTMNSTGTTTTTTTTAGDYNNAATTSSMNMRPDRDRALGDKDGKFGVYAGVNFSRFVNEPIPDGAYRAGWQLGLYGRTAGTVFGQLGVEYRNSTTNLVRSGSNQSTPTVGEVRGKIDQHFLAIPAYVGLRIGGTLGLRIQAGAELSALVAIGDNNFRLGNDDVKRTILNGLVGAGINLGPLTLDALYNHGLQNVFENADTKRNMLALNLGFRF